MNKCPVCSAEFPEGDRCEKCGAGTGLLRDVKNRALDFHKRSLMAYGEERFEDMYKYAMRSLELNNDPETRKTAACAALLTRRFDQASRS